MQKQYILYHQTTPFLGYLREWGFTDPDAVPDGSTGYERIQRMLIKYPDLALHLFASGQTFTENTREEKKFDPGTGTLVDLEAGDITPAAQAVLDAATKAQAIIDNLPSWAEIDAAIEAATTIAAMKVIVRKMARVVYWLAKNSAD